MVQDEEPVEFDKVKSIHLRNRDDSAYVKVSIGLFVSGTPIDERHWMCTQPQFVLAPKAKATIFLCLYDSFDEQTGQDQLGLTAKARSIEVHIVHWDGSGREIRTIRRLRLADRSTATAAVGSAKNHTD